ncbi:hypothetical protein LTR28_007473 [Elasticomyces elasticus]|nr:hypothetical protein LTR28_007473 [Elasticomyces elasticus]
METLQIEDDEEWAQAEGVPALSEPFIQKYMQGRDALVAQEKRQRSDHAFRQTLSPMAAEACSIVAQIRFQEQQTIWTSDLEDSLAEEGDVFPGMMFTMAKERMEKTKLWQIVRKMPKGALLHCHLEAMVDLEWLVEEALRTDGLHMSCAESFATPEARQSCNFRFQYLKSSQAETVLPWSESYTADHLVPLHRTADSFPDGGRAGFISWLKARLTITHSESVSHHLGPNDVWRKFTSIFEILGSLVYYEPIFRAFIRRMFQQLLDDGVNYVELRAAFCFRYYKVGSETPEEGYEACLGVLDEEIEAFKRTEAGKEFWGARMIWTTLRSFGTRQIIESMKQCIDMKFAYPDLIAGFDLVGQEDLGRPLADLTPELFWFKKQCAQEGIDIPFFFHAGETLGDGDEADENLFDAVLLGTRRLGHAFSLYKHPLLCDMVKEKRILVESCPISNEVLRLTGSIMSHPLPALLARGVPVALCNDDPAILGQGRNGMTHDFWQALQGWENLGLEGLAHLAENSIRWAAFDDYAQKEWLHEIKMGHVGKGIKARRMQDWAKQWEIFCQWIVLEFGVDQDLDPEE